MEKNTLFQTTASYHGTVRAGVNSESSWGKVKVLLDDSVSVTNGRVKRCVASDELLAPALESRRGIAFVFAAGSRRRQLNVVNFVSPGSLKVACGKGCGAILKPVGWRILEKILGTKQ